MTVHFYDYIGILGASAILLAYFLLQVNKMSSEGLLYSLVNCVGALFILYSLFYAWNLTAVFIEIIWLGISIYGLVKWFKARYQTVNFKD